MAVSVIVSNFNGAKYLPRLLDTLGAQQGVSAEVIVVDRLSTDGSKAILDGRAGVRVVSEPPESGLAAGYAAGVPHARYEHLFFCNEDMWFAPDCLARLEAQLDLRRSVACADPWQWSYDGARLIHTGAQLRRGRHRGSPHPWYHTAQTEALPCGSIVAVPCAGAMMVHRKAYAEIGGWDRSFFLDQEDLDLALRLWRHGWHTVIVPEAKVYHAVGASNAHTLGARRERVSERRYVCGASNAIVVVWKHCSARWWWLPLVPWLEKAAHNMVRLRLRTVLWDLAALHLTLARLPAIRSHRRANLERLHAMPGEAYFRHPAFQWGVVSYPPDGEAAAQPGEIRLSVAIVTRNRPEWLEQCLRSWRCQVPQPYEIVVSDDSDAEVEPRIRTIAAKYGCRWARGPKRGLYANRNHAASCCTGTHMLSADDDHTHPPGFLSKVLECIAQDRGRIWIFSERAADRPDEPYTCPVELTRDGAYRQPADPSDCVAIACGASAYPREVYDRGLRCSESYPFGGIWHLWAHTLHRAGFRISFCPDTHVWHHTGSSADRAGDEAWQRTQVECSVFVLAVLALKLAPSAGGWLRLVKHAVAAMAGGGRIVGVPQRIRLTPAAVARSLYRAWRAV